MQSSRRCVRKPGPSRRNDAQSELRDRTRVVGRMMDELEELGVLENTLVISLNDNDPNTRRYVGPFRGMKGEVYEGGIRSPEFELYDLEYDPGETRNLAQTHPEIVQQLKNAYDARHRRQRRTLRRPGHHRGNRHPSLAMTA